jgi:hypothetical protein
MWFPIAKGSFVLSREWIATGVFASGLDQQAIGIYRKLTGMNFGDFVAGLNATNRDERTGL